MDFDQPGMFSRTDALLAGYSDDDLRRGRSTGELFTIRRGHFIRTEVYRTLDAAAQHLLLAFAIHAESGTRTVFSHVSAAALHGMELWDIPLRKATFTIDRAYASKRGRQRFLHSSPISDDDVTELAGYPVTTPARTVVDLARSLPLTPAVCVGDHALRAGLTTHEQLSDALTNARNRTGIAKARQAVGLMSDRSASVGETRSRLLLDTLPLPQPLVGEWVHDEQRDPVGRVSFLYPEHGVLGKYEGDGLYGAEPPVSEIESKRHRNRFEELGWIVVRWNWQDLANPKELTDRVARAFVLAGRNRAPTGSVGPRGQR